MAFLHDLRQALRGLRRTPGFTGVALLTLALGIGASTAVFSVLQTLFLKPLPFAEPERLVHLHTTDPNGHFPGARFLRLSAAGYRDIQERQQVFSGVAAYQPKGATLTGLGDAERVLALRVTGSFFQVLGVRAALGRALQPADERGPSTVVLSHRFWMQRGGGDPAILGRTLTVNGRGHVVVGIMAPDFAWQDQPELFLPAPPTPQEMQEPRGTLAFDAIARVKPGVSLEQAGLAMDQLGRGLRTEIPEAKEWGIGSVRLWEFLYGDRRATSGLLLLTGLFVLVIACANLANLMISRAASRQREMALRTALGGGLKEALRPFLADGLVVSLAGGALGLLLAGGLSGFLRPYVPPELESAYGLNARVLCFTLGLCGLTTLVSGLVPALLFSRLHLSRSLAEGNRGTEGRSTGWLRNGLVTAQVALTLTLLVSFAALWQSLRKLQQAPMGFLADQALAFTVRPNAQKYPEDAQQEAYIRRIVQGLSNLPGVKVVGSVSATPLTASYSGDFLVPGREGASFSAHYRSVSPRGFEALGQPLLRGRDFGDGDCGERPLNVIVSRSLAARCWPGENPIGKSISKAMYSPEPTAFQIVGVVDDVRHEGAAVDRNLETIYWPSRGIGWGNSCRIVVRTEGNPLPLVPAVRSFLRGFDPELPLTGIQTLRSVLDDGLAASRTQATLMGLLAGLALALAAAGLYGVMAYSVSQRRREIGIRKALGGQDWQVVWEIARWGLVLTAHGLGIGVLLTLLLGRILANLVYGVSATDLVYGVSATDPLSIALAGLAFGLVALAAALIPASRAARLNPMEVLRSE
jgi:putative ABC transport system permease protein